MAPARSLFNFAAGGWIEGVTTFDVRTGKPGAGLAMKGRQVHCLDASLDSRLLDSGTDELKVWDARMLKQVLSSQGRKAQVAARLTSI